MERRMIIIGMAFLIAIIGGSVISNARQTAAGRKLLIIISGAGIAGGAYRLCRREEIREEAKEIEAAERGIAFDFQAAVTAVEYSKAELNKAEAFKRMAQGISILQKAGKADPLHQTTADPDEPEPLPNLLDVIGEMSRLLIIGGMGTGKSELLRHLVSIQADRGHVIICDSHASPSDWPPFVQVAGIGRDYAMIEATINSVCNTLNERYSQRAQGVTRFDRLTLVIDEMFVLNQFCDVQEQMKSLLAESRKVNIGLITAGQSNRASALGLAGNKDLVGGYEAVVNLRKENGLHIASVEIGDTTMDALHPGVFMARRHGFNKATESDFKHTSPPCDTVTSYPELPSFTGEITPSFDTSQGGITGRIYESHDERRIVEGFEAGMSLNKICRDVLGKNPNGRLTGYLKEILAGHGL